MSGSKGTLYKASLSGFVDQQPLPEGKTYKELRAMINVPSSVPVICESNGRPVYGDKWEVVPASDAEVAFTTIPAGGGGGRKNIFRTIAQIVVLNATIVASVLTGGAATAALGPTAGGILSSLAGAAVAVGGGLLVNAIIPVRNDGNALQLAAQQEAASPTYSLQAQGNSARLGRAIPRTYGRHIIYPDFASAPYADFENNDQFLYELFCLGLGEYDVEEIRIEDTPIWDSTNGLTGSIDDVEIEIVPPGGEVTLFPAEVVNSVEVGGQALEVAGEYTGPFVAVPADKVTKRIAIDVVMPAGIYFANNQGHLNGVSVGFNALAREIDTNGDPVGDWFFLGQHTYTMATRTPQRRTEYYDVPLGRYEVQVTRNTAKSTDIRRVNDITWAGMRAVIPSEVNFANTTMLAVKFKATDQLSQAASRKISVILTGKVPVWDGTSWSQPQATQNPAWVMADVLRNSVYGRGAPDSQIDLDTLLSLANTWGTRGDTFNGVFDTKQAIWEVLSQVAKAGRAYPILLAGKVTFVRDEPRLLPRGMFTPSNIVAGSFETTHVLADEDSPDDVIVEFINEDTWKRDEVQCTLEGSTSERPARVKMFGITNRDQAYREGMYLAAVNLKRRTFARFTTELEGRLLLRGDTVTVAHDMPRWGQSGEVRTFSGGNTLTLDRSLVFASGSNHYVVFRQRDNKPFGPILCTQGTSSNQLVLDAVSLAQVEAAQFKSITNVIDVTYDRDPTQYSFGTAETVSRDFIVVETRPQGLDKMDIYLVNNDETVHDADTGVVPPKVSPYGPGSIPDAPAITSLDLTSEPEVTGGRLVMLSASWQASEGATDYIAQISYDNETWTTVHQGADTQIEFSAGSGDVWFRVAAIGRVQGKFSTVSGSFGVDSSAPQSITGLSSSIDTPTGILNTAWAASLRASSYTLNIYEEGGTAGIYDVLVLTKSNVQVTETTFTASQVIAAGGPWGAYRAEVIAVNVSGNSEPVSVIVS